MCTLFCFIFCSLSSLICSCIWVPHVSTCCLVLPSAFNRAGKLPGWNLHLLESLLEVFLGDRSDTSWDAIMLDSVAKIVPKAKHHFCLAPPTLAKSTVAQLPSNRMALIYVLISSTHTTYTVTYLYVNQLILDRRNSWFSRSLRVFGACAFPEWQGEGRNTFAFQYTSLKSIRMKRLTTG